MKEIIYIQAGSLANYIGTHFWNAQDCYIREDEAVDSSISFLERLSTDGHGSHYPRVLIFDKREAFGTLSQANAQSGINKDEFILENTPEYWPGGITEYRQTRIPKSAYHTQIDAENQSDDMSHELAGSTSDRAGAVRYWSDLSHVYYMPRSVQRLPELLSVESQAGEWASGQRDFAQYDQKTGFLEDDFRLFLEECDSPQGLQIMNDTSYFGGFMHALLESVHDDYPKLPCLAFPLISAATPWHMPSNQSSQSAINDALYLRSLRDLASITVPILPSALWDKNAWNYECLGAESDSVYHTSAILSSHIETATFPLRSKGGTEDLRSLHSRLTWRGPAMPFAELSGIFPEISNFEEGKIARFSTLAQEKSKLEHVEFADISVTRGLSPTLLASYNAWDSRRLNRTRVSYSMHASSYPIPTSFPAFFKNSMDQFSRSQGTTGRGLLIRPRETSVFSSLSSSTRISQNFSAYATMIEALLKRNSNIENMDLHVDDLRELVSDLWTMHDSAGGEVFSSDSLDE